MKTRALLPLLGFVLMWLLNACAPGSSVQEIGVFITPNPALPAYTASPTLPAAARTPIPSTATVTVSPTSEPTPTPASLPVVGPSPFQSLPTHDPQKEKIIFLRDDGMGPGYVAFDPFDPDPIDSDYFKTFSTYPNNLAFANFAQLVGYWEKDYNLWLSDLEMGTAHMILENMPDLFEKSFLIWSPDDRHLMLMVAPELRDPPQNGPAERMIYHVLENQWEPWPYTCDRIARSPRTHRLALVCPSFIQDETQTAVIEWGGEIWYGAEALPDALVQWNIFSFSNAAWSADGSKVAYIDPSDPEGYLYIAQAGGTVEKILPGTGYYLSPVHQQASYFLQQNPIAWSGSGDRILFLGRGTDLKPCPPTILHWTTGETIENDACWQVFDTNSKQVIWQLSDSIPQILAELIFDTAPSAVDFGFSALSFDGDFIVLSGFSTAEAFSTYTLVVDIKTRKVVVSHPIGVETIRWGDKPAD